MDLSAEELSNIEAFAKLHFTIEEVCIIMQIPLENVIEFKQPNSAFYLAYQKGNLQSQAELRESIFKLAKNGSAPAQALAIKIIEDLYKLQIDT